MKFYESRHAFHDASLYKTLPLFKESILCVFVFDLAILQLRELAFLYLSNDISPILLQLKKLIKYILSIIFQTETFSILHIANTLYING